MKFLEWKNEDERKNNSAAADLHAGSKRGKQKLVKQTDRERLEYCEGGERGLLERRQNLLERE
ncbi:hypothetical protein D8674_008832 [Pyrus ussuriensis x Pyrus communis]|uniref:Uncharacterized protein n=1 Tax=Pyrus ussuriensis x Pyrus communis TaxID=2448454 RepID=A0A5N5HWZ2_9ROSA|nr:hypothetical protein D8674_008832 [Pyrus ussuriensis x Pyrus communis]